MANWNEVGNRAFNILFNTFRKTDDVDEAEQSFDGEIIDQMEAVGIEFENGWEFDLPTEAITEIVTTVVKRAKDNGDENLYYIIHPFLSNKLFETKDLHGEDAVSKWDDILGVLLD